MASKVYPKYMQEVLKGTADTDLDQTGSTAGVFVQLIDTDTYTYSDTHQYYSDLSGTIDTEVELTTKTLTNGVLDADNVTFTTVTATDIDAIVVFRKTAGANSTWPLVALIDTTNITGFPASSSGGDITIAWNASGIVKFSNNA